MACAKAEAFRAINELVGKMSPVLRQAFMMVYYDELTIEEAGALLGVTAGTFKSREPIPQRGNLGSSSSLAIPLLRLCLLLERQWISC
jgi:hypothetical protein